VALPAAAACSSVASWASRSQRPGSAKPATGIACRAGVPACGSERWWAGAKRRVPLADGRGDARGTDAGNVSRSFAASPAQAKKTSAVDGRAKGTGASKDFSRRPLAYGRASAMDAKTLIRGGQEEAVRLAQACSPRSPARPAAAQAPARRRRTSSMRLRLTPKSSPPTRDEERTWIVLAAGSNQNSVSSTYFISRDVNCAYR